MNVDISSITTQNIMNHGVSIQCFFLITVTPRINYAVGIIILPEE